MSDRVACLDDKLFDLTTNLNNYFAQHVGAKHAFMITCGFMMDIMVVVSFYRFALKGSSWRLPLAMVVFYGARGIVQVNIISIYYFAVGFRHALPRWLPMGLPRDLFDHCALWTHE